MYSEKDCFDVKSHGGRQLLSLKKKYNLYYAYLNKRPPLISKQEHFQS